MSVTDLDSILLDDEFLQRCAEFIKEQDRELLPHEYLEYPTLFNRPVKILSLSGGATRFSGILGSGIEVVKQGYRPDIILGVSAGAIGVVPLALGLFDQLHEKGDNLTPQKFFVRGKHPITKKGKPHPLGLLRILSGAVSLGEQDVRPLLREVITEELWEEYITGDYPDVVVFSVTPYDGKIQHFFLKEFKDREQAFEKICASSRIAPIVQPMQTEDMMGIMMDHVDGGFRVHNAAGYFLRKYKKLEVSDLVSVYSRPKDWVVLNEKWADNFFNVTERMLMISAIEVSKGNEREETYEMLKRGGNHTKIFLPSIIKGTYGTGDDLKKLRLMSEKIAAHEYNKTYGIA